MTRLYAVFFRPGPRWLEGKTIFEQPLDSHVAYLKSLYEKGIVLLAGPLEGSGGGLTILQLADEEEAQTLIEADPAISQGVLTYTLHRWYPIAWDTVTADNLLYETPPLRTRRELLPRPRMELDNS